MTDKITPAPPPSPAQVEQAESCGLRLCAHDDVHAEGCMKHQPEQPSPARSDKDAEPIYFVRYAGQDGWKEATEEAYWLFSEGNRRILYEQAERAQSGENIATWQERDPVALHDPLIASICMQAEIDDLRAALARSEESVSQYQQNVHELAEELRLARRATAGNAAPRLACTHCHSTKQAGKDKCSECGHSEFKPWAEITAGIAAAEKETPAISSSRASSGRNRIGEDASASSVSELDPAGNAAPVNIVEADCHPTCGYIGADCNYPACKMSFASNAAPVAAQLAHGERTAPSAEANQQFYNFWYSHMVGDTMTGVLADISHSTARYVWDASLARNAATAAPGDDEIMQQYEHLVADPSAIRSGDYASVIKLVRHFIASNAGAAPAKQLAHGHRDDWYLMANARRIGMMPIRQVANMTNWSFAHELFATGSNSSHQICVEAGIDPAGYTVERAPSNPPVGAKEKDQ